MIPNALSQLSTLRHDPEQMSNFADKELSEDVSWICIRMRGCRMAGSEEGIDEPVLIQKSIVRRRNY